MGKAIYILIWTGQVLLVVFISLLLNWAVPHSSKAREYGIASRYVGDRGIENDPDVVFAEDFERLTLGAILSGWEYSTHEERMSISSDIPSVSSGKQSLFYRGSADMYQRLLPGHDQLYIRFYAKFEALCENVSHWVTLGGRNPSTPWPWPEAGKCPEGDERWSTAVESMGSHWSWDFYTYWMRMRSAPDGFCWGNTFSGRPSPWPAVRGEWICVEFMVKMNAPVTSYNGEQAFWINGEKMAHLGQGFPLGTWIWDGFYPKDDGTPFEGFQWRKIPELNINYVWLEHYVPNDPACGCWFDDLVIAKKYVGPIPDPQSIIYVDQSGLCNGFSPCFSTIQEGIDFAVSESTIRVVHGKYPEDITIDEAKNLTIEGGWDDTFTTQSPTTTIKSIMIGGSAGTVALGNLTIQ